MCVITHAAPSEVDETEVRRALRSDVFDALCNARGLDTDLKRSQALKISHTTMSRIRSRKANPGGKFIAAALELLNVPYAALFEDVAK